MFTTYNQDVKSNHITGACFDPLSDADVFCGSDYEFLAIMDRYTVVSLRLILRINFDLLVLNMIFFTSSCAEAIIYTCTGTLWSYFDAAYDFHLDL